MCVESLFQFLLQRGEFLRQLGFVDEQCSHFQERTYDEHAHLYGSPTVQNIGCHDCTMLSEHIRSVSATSMARTRGANLLLQVLPFILRLFEITDVKTRKIFVMAAHNGPL